MATSLTASSVKVLALVTVFVFIANAHDSRRSIFPALVPETEAHALLGHPVRISCSNSLDTPISSCRWDHRLSSPSFPTSTKRYMIYVSSDVSKEKPDVIEDDRNPINCNCSYEFTGPGLQHGDCSINIRNVSEFHLGEWSCLLTNDNEETWIGVLNVSELVPVTPYFEEGEVSEDLVYNETSPKTTNVTCCVAENHAVSQLHLNIFLKNQETSQIFLEKNNRDDISVRHSTLCRHKTFSFLPEHNGQLLTCEATYLYHHEEYNTSITQQLHVKYAPTLKPKNFTQKLIESKNILQANITFNANPRPNTVEWSVVKTENKNPFVIEKNTTKYRTSLVQLKNSDEYSAYIQILNVTGEDYENKYVLCLSNPYGSKEISFHIIVPEENQDLYWIIISIALGLAILSAFVVTAICIGVKYKEGNRGDYSPTTVKFSAREQPLSSTTQIDETS